MARARPSPRPADRHIAFTWPGPPPAWRTPSPPAREFARTAPRQPPGPSTRNRRHRERPAASTCSGPGRAADGWHGERRAHTSHGFVEREHASRQPPRLSPSSPKAPRMSRPEVRRSASCRPDQRRGPFRRPASAETAHRSLLVPGKERCAEFADLSSRPTAPTRTRCEQDDGVDRSPNASHLSNRPPPDASRTA